MATGISPAEANTAINAVVAKGTWVQLHIGDPGAAGTANTATETTRKQATMASASGGSASSSADLEWTSVATADPDTYSHFSMWTASTAGSFLWSGTVTANAVSDGDTFRIPSGSFTLSMTGAA